nr:putative F-box protein At3g25750 [Tanacetum cinerariifolium]
MKAKFVALDKAIEEAEWLRSFLEGIPLWPKPVTAVCIHCDSMSGLTRTKNHIYNSKSRNIRRRYNTIKDLLRNEIISIDYVKSKEKIADPLTKGLYREQVIFTSRDHFPNIDQNVLVYLHAKAEQKDTRFVGLFRVIELSINLVLLDCYGLFCGLWSDEMAHVVSEVVFAVAMVKVEDSNGYISTNIEFSYVCSG